MAELTSLERLKRVYAHKDPDRVPMFDGPWTSTLARWRREGLPEGVDFAQFFGFDRSAYIGADNSPRFPTSVVKETDEWVISKTAWGATMRNWKHAASTPDFLDFEIKDRASWAAAKKRMTPSEDRVDWKHLEANYANWRREGCWIQAGGWFGYDVFASWHVGTERMLIAMAEDPDWCQDMFTTALELNLTLLDRAWERGYRFDCFTFPDDLGYRNGPFFSPRMYREVVKPVHRRAFDWAHAKGAVTMMHSCGNILPLLPDLIEAGLDGLNPLETKAGMDLVQIKRQYGSQLVLQGGIDVRKMTKADEIESEIRTKLEVAKRDGGYIYHSDHSVPSDVSFADYCRVVALVRYYGGY